ncbi:MAG: FABP family protein [Propionibacteriaceae bacterium]|nr:FABP family protein [Propionibacteriaceae bacterium]
MGLDPRLAHLVGTWCGTGVGCYPTIADFTYTDQISFTDIGKPFLHFIQRTWMDGEPRHTETGYWRMPTPDAVEVVIALPTGQAERGSGTCRTDEDGAIVIETDSSVQNTPTAKQVDRIVRHLHVEGDRMHYEVFMEAVGHGLTLHLSSDVRRQPLEA